MARNSHPERASTPAINRAIRTYFILPPWHRRNSVNRFSPNRDSDQVTTPFGCLCLRFQTADASTGNSPGSRADHQSRPIMAVAYVICQRERCLRCPGGVFLSQPLPGFESLLCPHAGEEFPCPWNVHPESNRPPATISAKRTNFILSPWFRRNRSKLPWFQTSIPNRLRFIGGQMRSFAGSGPSSESTSMLYSHIHHSMLISLSAGRP